MLRAYRYQIYPTETQRVLLAKHFGCARWVYNWALAERTDRYKSAGIHLSVYELQRQLPELKRIEPTKWLGEVASQCLQCALFNNDTAFSLFFKKNRKYPRFKSKTESFQSYSLSQHTRLDFSRGLIHLTAFKEGIKGCFNRRFEGKIKTCTVSRTPTGKHYVSVLVDDGLAEPVLVPLDESKALGLDFGLKDLVVTNEGERFANPRALKRYLRRLKQRQRSLSRKVKGSKNRAKARLIVAKTHERISFIRNDNLHKTSAHLVRKNQATTLCLEDLAVREMMHDKTKPRSLRRSIGDAGWGELRRQIEYKARWAGKNVKIIGRWETSSKTCSCCGTINRELTLADRSWTCVCGASHDRDINAAINIKRMAFASQNTFSSISQEIEANYRQVSREDTPVDQGFSLEMKQEHQSQSLTESDSG